MADVAGDDLINGSARTDVRSRRLFDANAGEKSAACPRMITAAIRSRVGAEVFQTGEDLELMADGFERLQGAGEAEIPATVPFRPPGGRDGAVGDIDKSHAHGGGFGRWSAGVTGRADQV